MDVSNKKNSLGWLESETFVSSKLKATNTKEESLKDEPEKDRSVGGADG